MGDVHRGTGEDEVVAALRTEVAGWEPRRVPNLADLCRPPERQWRRPVLLASTVGAVALAIVLVASVVMVVLAPAFPGGEVIRAHLVAH
jgi:hypothetical protein